MAENVERINQVYYTLFSQPFGLKKIQDPKGWQNDYKNYEIDPDSKSIESKISVDLEFFGNGYEYLKNMYSSYGINEKVILTKYERDTLSISESYNIKYIQTLDFTTYDNNHKTKSIKIKATKGGLFEDIKNRESDEYDILNNLSADNIDIGYIETVPFQPKGRDIFIESLLEAENVNDYRLNSQRFARVSNATGKTVRTIPMTVVYNSDQEDISTPMYSQDGYNDQVHSQSYDLNTDQDIRNLFFYEAEGDESVYLNLTLDYKISEIRSRSSNPTNFSVEIFVTEKDGDDDKLIQKIPVYQVNGTSNILNEIGVQKNLYQTTSPINLTRNASIGVVFTSVMSYNGNIFAPRGETDFFFNIEKSKLVVRDVTNYIDYTTVSRAIKPLQIFDRLISKITGEKGLVKSSIFELGGQYENILVDNGLWARNFPDSYEDSQGNEQSIQMVMSYKNAFKSFSYLEPLTWFVEIIGNKEYVRIEKATYTMQNFIGLKLTSVDDIKSKSSKPDYFSSVEIGHSKSMEYEEINGLDEYNGKSNFNTFITKNISKYSVLSKIRTDAVAYELTRRIDFVNNPKKDTKRDSDLWMHDAKIVNGVYTHKLWQDEFDSAPTGIYSPNTAWNLFLSPINRLFYGHGYSVKRGLYHFPKKFITFNSSNSNQNLVTVRNGFELQEGGVIKIEDIKKPKVEATRVTLTFKMTQEIQDTLDGYTDVLGEKVKNTNGLVEYINDGLVTYGRIIKIESKEKATMELIKARL
jgi:hypothetical protein